MKVSKQMQEAQEKKIAEAVAVLMQYGLPDPVSAEFKQMGATVRANNILIPLPSTYHGGARVDLSAIAPDKILIAMFDFAYKLGIEHGTDQAERQQGEALLQAFPTLKHTIRELADEVARERIQELEQNRP